MLEKPWYKRWWGILFISIGFVVLLNITQRGYKQNETDSAKQPAFTQNEKNILLHSTYFGDLEDTKKKKFSEIKMIELHVWNPYATYQTKISKAFTPPLKFPLDGVLKVSIRYNVIWEAKKEGDPKVEDHITTIYWLDDQVQAISYENRFIGNPLTGKKLVSPAYKITGLYDRVSVFKTLEKYR
jgi:hypothetical protein